MPHAGLYGMSGTDEERSHNEEQTVASDMWGHPALVRGCLRGQASLFCGMKLLILLHGCREGSALVPLRNCSILQDNIFWLVISLMQMREEPEKQCNKTLILLLSQGKPRDKFSYYKRERGNIFLNFCLAKTDGKKEDCEEVVWWAICLRFDANSVCQEHVRANAGRPASITSSVSAAW